MTARTIALSMAALAVLATPVWAGSAAAQDQGPAGGPVQEGWQVNVGAGVLYAPAYEVPPRSVCLEICDADCGCCPVYQWQFVRTKCRLFTTRFDQ